MSLGLQPDTQTPSRAAPEFLHVNLSWFFFKVLSVFLPVYMHKIAWNFFLLTIKKKEKKKVAHAGLSLVRMKTSCFYIPVLLPVQSSMHGWTGLTLGRSHPARQGSPGCVGPGDPGNQRASRSSCIHPRVPRRCALQVALRIFFFSLKSLGVNVDSVHFSLCYYSIGEHPCAKHIYTLCWRCY